MYTRFKELKFNSNTFDLIYQNGRELHLVLEDPTEMFFIDKYNDKKLWLCKNNFMLIVTPKEIEFLQGSKVIETLYLFKEIIYYINKDIKKYNGFSLEYRKHLQLRYEKTVKIILSPGQPSNIFELYNNEIENLKEKLKSYSHGKHQPVIIIISKIDDFLKYIVIVDGNEKENGTLNITQKGA